MSNVLIIIPPNGQLPRRAIDFIRHAPTDMRITVKRIVDKAEGYSIDFAIIDDTLAELTSSEAAYGEAKGDTDE